MVDLKEIKDFRNQSYICYDSSILIMSRLLAECCHLKSRNDANIKFNKDSVIKNFALLFDDSIEESPHGDTIINFLINADIDDFRRLIYNMANGLIRKKILEDNRIRGHYDQIIIDGVQLFSTHKPRVEGALVRHHKEGNITYHTQVLTAYLSAENMVIPIDFEWIENEKDDISKQDCELNAAKRLLKRIKENFKRRPLCISGDGLYFSEEMLQICEKNKWKYTVTLKEGRAPAFYAEYEEMKKGKYTTKENEYKTDSKGRTEKVRIYEYVNQMDYGNHKINIMEVREGGKTFLYATNFLLDEKNIRSTIAVGRERWKIENKGFNDEKNHDYGLTHACSYHANAIKLIAHLFLQLLEMYKNSTGNPTPKAGRTKESSN